MYDYIVMNTPKKDIIQSYMHFMCTQRIYVYGSNSSSSGIIYVILMIQYNATLDLHVYFCVPYMQYTMPCFGPRRKGNESTLCLQLKAHK